MQEAIGSSPIISTTNENELGFVDRVRFFSFFGERSGEELSFLQGGNVAARN